MTFAVFRGSIIGAAGRRQHQARGRPGFRAKHCGNQAETNSGCAQVDGFGWLRQGCLRWPQTEGLGGVPSEHLPEAVGWYEEDFRVLPAQHWSEAQG
jgi:hypothetical protein